ncbi:MAG: hypothetical protein IH945_12185 [Armatimonadetes bacterium]|nr:hypothetical protein [Armatimonadota bacterium]
MSVAKLRSSFEKKGCRIALWVLMVGAAFAIAGTGFMGCFANQPGLISNPALETEILKVDGQSISLAAVNAEIAHQRQDLSNMRLAFGGQPEPFEQYQAMAYALSALVATSVHGSLARSLGVTVDEGTVLAMVGQQVDQALFDIRQKAIADGDLPPNPTEQEFQDYYQQENGQSASEFKQQVIDSFRTQLENTAQREALLGQFSGAALSLRFYTTTVVTEDEVRRSYETLSLQVISFDDLEMSIEQRRAEAEKALAELDDGAGFESVMRKYMEAPVTEPMEYRRGDLDSDEQLKPLNDLELGQNDRVLLDFGVVPTIYRLIEVKSDLPEDFDDIKDIYTDQLRGTKSNLALQQAVKDGIASANIEWSSAGYETVYTLFTSQSNPDLSEDDYEQYLRQVAIASLPSDDPAGLLPGALARYVAMEQLQVLLSDQEREEMIDARAVAILGVLDVTESVSLRLALVDLYGEQEDWAAQADAILMAAEMNTGQDLMNQIYHGQISQKLTAMEAEERIDDTKAAEVHGVLLDWSEAMSEASQAAAAAVVDLEKFNVDPVTGEPVGSGKDDEGGSEPDEEDEGDSEQSGDG